MNGQGLMRMKAGACKSPSDLPTGPKLGMRGLLVGRMDLNSKIFLLINLHIALRHLLHALC